MFIDEFRCDWNLTDSQYVTVETKVVPGLSALWTNQVQINCSQILTHVTPQFFHLQDLKQDSFYLFVHFKFYCFSETEAALQMNKEQQLWASECSYRLTQGSRNTKPRLRSHTDLWPPHWRSSLLLFRRPEQLTVIHPAYRLNCTSTYTCHLRRYSFKHYESNYHILFNIKHK